MRLKFIEIKGFKSFADKAKISFDSNITGIVGPNGCGKSNVIDAIRWVLGEQKTSNLRLEKMDNVLFNGTKQRKATALAEVHLCFENTKNLLNSEFNEVVITRKLYRSGESEYRINDIACRLKDINNLFVDTGIGSNSYAIIELGMVDEILTNKDQSRRRLFEQAASITKYKQNKKEALAKLANTETDLNRLQDILTEVNTAVNSLASQAQKALKYKEIREEQKSLKLKLLTIQANLYKENYNSTLSQSKIYQNEKISIENQLNQVEAQIQKIKVDFTSREQALFDKQKQLNTYVSELSKGQNQINLLQEQINQQKIQEKNIFTQKSDLQTQIITLQEEIHKNVTLLHDVNATINLLEKDTREIQDVYETEKANYQEIKLKIDADKSELLQIHEEIVTLDRNLAIVSHENAQLESEKIQLNQEIFEKQKKLNELKAQRETLEKISLDFQNQINQQNIVFQTKKEQEDKITAQKDELQLEIAQIHRKIDSKNNEFTLIKSMIDNLEGYPQTIKLIKKNYPGGRDILTISEIIEANNEFKPALELLLRDIGDFLIVEDDKAAFSLVQFLQENHGGRAGIVVLGRIPSVDKPLKHPNMISASQIIHCDLKYRKLIDFIFQETYISDLSQLDADKIYDQLEIGQKWISFDAALLLQYPYLVGGSTNLFDGNSVGRKQNLSEIEAELTELQKNLKNKEGQLDILLNSLKNINISENIMALEQLNQSLLTKNQDLQQLDFMLKQHIDLYNQTELRLKSLDEKSITLKAKYEDLNLKKTLTLEKQNTFQPIDQSQEDTLVAWYASIEAKREAFLNSKNQLELTQSKAKQIQEQLDFHQNNAKRLESKLEELTHQLNENKASMISNESKLNDLTQQTLISSDTKKDLDSQISLLEESYYNLRAQIEALEKNQRMLTQNKLQNMELINSHELKIQDMQHQLKSIRLSLKEDFNIDFEDFFKTLNPIEEQEDEIRTNIEKKEKQLLNLGQVNPLSIEAYEETNQRLEFLVTQRNDILESKADLLKTLSEIDTTAKEKFLTAFEEIRANFIKTFRVLFTQDDDCDLILVDPQNPLDSDIDIVAKPKGKKPLTIQQLSGGEKTLTATALLFSLYLLKPAPFCIFDEVDAPLDDTNIDKFNRIIQQFSAESQFIIVTHNKQTMAYVESLYGVTMQEQGVSMIVPVKFQDLN
ncbi:MAG: chromosome segregation protein SMC [Chitinophagales bacterium]|jgi:chromosome segregation protein|nr:chromosome segregation protein SMC [Chitinophagales bacterium]